MDRIPKSYKKTQKTLVWRPENDFRKLKKHREKTEIQSEAPSQVEPILGLPQKRKVRKPKTKEELEAQKRDEGYGRLYIRKQIKYKVPMVLEMYKHYTVKGIITNRFTYSLRVNSEGNMLQVHKLNIKFLYKQENEELVKKSISADEGIRSQSLSPILSRSERYNIDDKLLHDCHSNGSPVRIATREGEIMSGVINWFNKFDIKVELADEVSVVIFRHAIYSFEVLKR